MRSDISPEPFSVVVVAAADVAADVGADGEGSRQDIFCAGATDVPEKGPPIEGVEVYEQT